MKNILMAAVAAVTMGMTGAAFASVPTVHHAVTAQQARNDNVLPSQRPAYLARSERLNPQDRPTYLSRNNSVLPSQRPAYLADNRGILPSQRPAYLG